MDIELDEAIEDLVRDRHSIEIGDTGGIQTGRIVPQGPAVRSSAGDRMGQLRRGLLWFLGLILAGTSGNGNGEDGTQAQGEHMPCLSQTRKSTYHLSFGNLRLAELRLRSPLLTALAVAEPYAPHSVSPHRE
jgi:hypothetical protein